MRTTDDLPRRIRTPADWGRMVREARKRQGLTQPQLAAASGTSIGFLVDLERGKETAQLGLALHVVTMLGIHLTAGRRHG
jgi:HTH-type transcriptional regulator/antitoxin HipB